MIKTNWECPQCGGYGVHEFEEDGRLSYDACYHCWNTGWVNYNPYPMTEDEVNEELQLLANEEAEYQKPLTMDEANGELQILAQEIEYYD